MLSPHEIATLMVLGHPQPPAGMDPEDIRVLVERRLVQLDAQAPAQRIQLTHEGPRLLQAVRSRRAAPDAAARWLA